MTDADYFDGPGPEKRYYDYLADGKFMIQRSKSSGNYVHYPRVMEPGTGAADLEWVEASGKGVVYATTVNRQRPEKGGDYNICLIDLAEGPRMMCARRWHRADGSEDRHEGQGEGRQDRRPRRRRF